MTDSSAPGYTWKDDVRGKTLLSDSTRLAAKARADGANVTLEVWDGMWHGFHDTSGIPEAGQACERVAAFFTQHLQQ